VRIPHADSVWCFSPSTEFEEFRFTADTFLTRGVKLSTSQQLPIYSPKAYRAFPLIPFSPLSSPDCHPLLASEVPDPEIFSICFLLLTSVASARRFIFATGPPRSFAPSLPPFPFFTCDKATLLRTLPIDVARSFHDSLLNIDDEIFSFENSPHLYFFSFARLTLHPPGMLLLPGCFFFISSSFYQFYEEPFFF